MRVAVVGAGVFVTDPGGGYPPGVFPPSHPTLHSTLHDVCSLVVFTVLPAVCLVLAREFHRHGELGWSWYSAVTGLVFSSGFAVVFLGYSADRGVADLAGLIQRVVVVIGWTWLSLVALHFVSGSSSPLVERRRARASSAGR